MKSMGGGMLMCWLLCLVHLLVVAAAGGGKSKSSGGGISLPWNDDVLGLIMFKADMQDPEELASWSEDDTSACKWRGVGCSDDGRVSSVTLDGLSLTGPLSRGLLKLDRLLVLSLSRNNLSGEVPAELGTALRSLANLSLAHNSLSGPIPDSLASLPSLAYLDLSHNRLSGAVPADLLSSSSSGLGYLSLSHNQLRGDAGLFLSSGCGPLLSTLDLSHNLITGELPPTQLLVGCSRLKVLDLSYNLLSGTLPRLLPRSLSALRLAANTLSGGIPAAGDDQPRQQHLAELAELDLSLNQLTGGIPGALCSSWLPSLERLWLHGNRLNGSLPAGMSACSRLWDLDLSGNNLTGELPSELLELDLDSLALSGNGFTGGLPAFSPLACKSLRLLDLSYNFLDGQLPLHLAQCSRLRSLLLDHNSLSGSIPQELAAMPELSELDLSDNGLTGYIPTSFDNATLLTSLRLSGNLLAGAVPVELGSCQSLTYLDLSYNNLSSGIPVELSDLAQLRVLDLSHNQLSGQIPASFGQLHKLSSFNVSHNSLAGPLPSTGVFQRLDASSFQGNAHLCGPPLKTSCPPIPKPIVLNPNATSSSASPIISSSPGQHRARRLLLSLSSILAISAAGVIAAGVLVVSLLNLHQQYRRRACRRANSLYVVEESLGSRSPSSSGCSQGDMGMGKLVMFTDNESDEELLLLLPTAQALLNTNTQLGSGMFGTVYRASLAAGRLVAVKKLHPALLAAAGQEQAEKRLHLMGRVQHQNLVSLQGYYWAPKLQLLIYDYVPNGSLYSKLHSLAWRQRLSVALGTAAGLAYLHHRCKPRLVHYNLKSSNVLLDHQLNALVSDYGLAKLLLRSSSSRHGTSRLQLMAKLLQQRQEVGYMAPEMTAGGDEGDDHRKVDVYALGVILLELVTGRMPVEYAAGGNELVPLSQRVRCLVDEGRQVECIDPLLGCDYPEDEVLTVLKLGLVCTSQQPCNRPSMLQVLQVLELIKPLGPS